MLSSRPLPPPQGQASGALGRGICTNTDVTSHNLCAERAERNSGYILGLQWICTIYLRDADWLMNIRQGCRKLPRGGAADRAMTLPKAARYSLVPRRFFTIRRKNTSDDLPIPFWFWCAGTLAHCSILI